MSAIVTSPASLTAFAHTRAGSVSATAQTLTVTGVTVYSAAFVATTGGAWLTVTNPTANPSVALASAVVAGLNGGTYTGNVVITSAGASNSPLSIPATLTVGFVTDELWDLVDSAVSVAAHRIFIATAPDDYTYVGPYIVIRGVGDESFRAFEGSSGLNNERFEFACFAKSADGGNKTCRAMAEAIRLALENYQITSGKVLQGATQVSRLDLFDLETMEHLVPIDFEVMYIEAQA